jgi:hypothetical protein
LLRKTDIGDIVAIQLLNLVCDKKRNK